MFERRHYEFLAGAIKRALPEPHFAEERRLTAQSFAHDLASDNPRFDVERWLKACDTE